MPGSESTRHVALLVETSNGYARGLLHGVREYVAVHRGWSLYLVEHSRLETDFSWLEGWTGDGVLARIESPEAAAFVRRLGLPAVDLSAGRLVPELPGAETDDDQIARWAVEHFAERGIRHFAFCGDPRYGWSVKRAESFVQHSEVYGAPALEFRLRPTGKKATDRDRLVRWLAGLPRPVGVLAAYDIAGQEVLEACKIAGLEVPDQVAVIGVDNDELLGTLSSPALSSIEPNTRRTGYLAAELLDRMMAGETVEPGLRLIPPVRVVVRQSSDLLSVDDVTVAQALRFIRNHAGRNITVTEVLREVGLSRRALDLRFLKHLGRTVHTEILRVRMNQVAELLGSTDWTMTRIAEHLGFPHAEYMGVAFKKHTGRSPGRYRRDVTGSVVAQGGWR
ncbi:DNA-binding transcriptional regulator [Occultella glacieicola]|uniref:DNA-binding transcriptional regulator n=1 Tax=Occultella glacieicola TaxID=2518684 RepID=A0ABY2DYJ0_9MICO|nr:DNA-binding transcriptional regulator [Occultella glacieicola]TDE89548.1 DNA-binding transcriptional regulator [Occultella glacieicola]